MDEILFRMKESFIKKIKEKGFDNEYEILSIFYETLSHTIDEHINLMYKELRDENSTNTSNSN